MDGAHCTSYGKMGACLIIGKIKPHKAEFKSILYIVYLPA